MKRSVAYVSLQFFLTSLAEQGYLVQNQMKGELIVIGSSLHATTYTCIGISMYVCLLPLGLSEIAKGRAMMSQTNHLGSLIPCHLPCKPLAVGCSTT